MTNTTTGTKYDLEERTATFGEAIINFSKQIGITPITRPLINQIIRSATSVGANYCEADNAYTKKDFRHRISIARKEARETKHWLRMISIAVPQLKAEAEKLAQEANELMLIFSAILRKTSNRE